MKRFLLTCLILLFLAQTADAQTYYFWRKRSHATDIDLITDGKAADLGLQESDNTLYRWNTSTSTWNQVSTSTESDTLDTVCDREATTNQIITAGGFTTTGTILASDEIASGYQYFGDKTTNGSWRVGINGTALVVERRESGSWVEKGAYTP